MKRQYEVMATGVVIAGRPAPVGAKFWADASKLSERDADKLAGWLRLNMLKPTGETDGPEDTPTAVHGEHSSKAIKSTARDIKAPPLI